MLTRKVAPPSQKKHQEEDIESNDLPVLLVIPDGLSIPPWTALHSDDFESSDPLCETVPLCLAPLPTGGSLLSANLSSIRRAGLRQVFILAHLRFTKMVEDHLNDTCCRRALRAASLSITLIPLPITCHCIADVLREAANSSFLLGLATDFCLVIADTLCFIDVSKMLLEHQALKRRKHLTASIMTRLIAQFDQTGIQSPLGKSLDNAFRQSPFDDCFLLLDESTSELLGYYSVATNSHLSLRSDVLGKVPGEKSLRLISNPIESGIDICSPQVFGLLEKSLDYQHIRPDLINGLTTAELKIESISAYTPSPSTTHPLFPSAMRVTTPESLLVLLKAMVISGQLHPDLFCSTMRQQRENCSSTSSCSVQLIHPSVRIPLSLQHQEDAFLGVVFIGKGAKFVDDAQASGALNVSIKNSFLGRDVHLKSNVTIANAIILNSVTVESGASCKDSLIYPNVIVQSDGSSAYDCQTPVDQDGVQQSEASSSRTGGSLSGIPTLVPLKTKLAFHRQTIPMRVKTFLDDEEEEFCIVEAQESEEDVLVIEGGTQRKNYESTFFKEVYITVLEGIRKPEYLSHKLMEVKSYRMSCRKSMDDCIRPCAKAFVDGIAEASPQSFLQAIPAVKPNLLFPAVAPMESQEAQCQLVDALLDYSIREIVDVIQDTELEGEAQATETNYASFRNAFFLPTNFCRMLQMLSRLEAVNDDWLPAWHEEARRNKVDSEWRRYLNHPEMDKYIQWLKQAEEESSSSGEDDRVHDTQT